MEGWILMIECVMLKCVLFLSFAVNWEIWVRSRLPT